MSSYHRIIYIFLLIGSTLLSNPSDSSTDDLSILVGLDKEFNNDFAGSVIIYEKLFLDTKSSEYLKRTIESYLAMQNFDKVILLAQENFEKYPEIKEELFYKYIVAAVMLKKYEDALVVAKELETYKSPKNSGLLGDLYSILDLYEDSLRNYEFGFQKLQTSNLAIVISNIYYVKLNNKSKAIEFLKTFIDKHGCNQSVCLKLLQYYQNEQNLIGMTEMMEKLYSEYKKEQKIENLVKFELTLAELYMQQNKQKAIDFLFETGNNNLMLASILEREGLYQKALEVLKKIYLETQDATILGRIAMLEFTIAQDKKLVINQVLKNFELALKEKSNADFENFYGYLLIDYNLDYKKGLALVKKAYDTNPENIAYKDSLAWGYFKNNECNLADKYISEVVQKVGFDDKIIQLHHTKIKNCLEKKKGKK